MFGSSSSPPAFFNNKYRWGDQWHSTLLKISSVGLLILVCGFYVAPEVAAIQTGFYLTLLLPALLLIALRKDWSFAFSWQFASFLLLPLVLAVSSLWASAEEADIQRTFPYYLKIALYLTLFYCTLFFVMERYGDAILRHWLLWLIIIGTASCIASLLSYIQADGLERLHRIGGISLGGDIDKTSLLYGFFAFFCCYGLTQGKYWRWLSLAGLLLACGYALLSQTKLPFVMVGAAVLCAAVITGRSSWTKLLLLLCAFTALPLIYLTIYGDLPLLHRTTAYSARIELWRQAFEQFMESPLLGSGLMYKRYLELSNVLPHPHNYLVDIARFSGLIGVTAAALQLITAAWILREPRKVLDWIPGLYIVWLGFGTLAMLIYAQQPLVKPSYIWFLYWIPLAVILVRCQLTTGTSKAHDTPTNSSLSESHG